MDKIETALPALVVWHLQDMNRAAKGYARMSKKQDSEEGSMNRSGKEHPMRRMN